MAAPRSAGVTLPQPWVAARSTSPAIRADEGARLISSAEMATTSWARARSADRSNSRRARRINTARAKHFTGGTQPAFAGAHRPSDWVASVGRLQPVVLGPGDRPGAGTGTDDTFQIRRIVH